jgi:5-formyltetrahydrofolate cyclo-ligase
MRQSKEDLRAGVLAQRSVLAKSEALAWSDAIQARALQFPPYAVCRSLALYSPIQNEVETGAIRDRALVAGKRVFFPRLGHWESLELVQIAAVNEMSSGRFGIPEPVGDRRLLPQDHAELVVFVPGVAFDLRGNRLGRGKGWYDRLVKTLAKATVVALAYDFQVLEEVPTEAWDEKVHYVITERRIVDCRSIPEQLDQVSSVD